MGADCSICRSSVRRGGKAAQVTDAQSDVTWSFRFRFRLGDRVRIDSTSAELRLPPTDIAPQGITLRPWLPDTTTIGTTNDLVLRGDGYPSQVAAHEAARRWRAVLQVAFATAQIGADFGRRVLDNSDSSRGLEQLTAQTGQRYIRDRLGPIVFATEPRPIFRNLSATGVAGRFEDHVLGALAVAAAQRVEADEKTRLAYDLFGASFSVDEPDARLMLLMMAVETLIDPKPRGAVIAHVQRLIAITAQADISAQEKQSITQSLSWLLRQSIGQAGRDLAANLGDRRYLDKSATRFFTDCYSVRSALAHGHLDRPHPTDVGRYAAHLEGFVSDLLARPLLDQLPRFQLEGPGRAAWDAAVTAARDFALEQNP